LVKVESVIKPKFT